jgi:urease accessory protein
VQKSQGEISVLQCRADFQQSTTMGWQGRLELDYRLDGDRCVAHDRHRGPLRVLRALHPEGPQVCHHVLVHPPGGIVGGDVLELAATLASRTHAVLTTPGATRFYRSGGEAARQGVDVRVDDGARLEWLPLETICHPGADASSTLRFQLAAGAETIGWDVVALGLPASGHAFDRGRYRQQIEVPGAWLERGVIDAADTRLLDAPLGLAGRRVLATLWFAAGRPLPDARRDALLDAARAAAADGPLARHAGATSPNPRVVVLRALAERVEPAMALLQRVWAQWRLTAWSLAACAPRVWRT